MDWYWTWQDPVALALCVVGLVTVWWLRRRSAAGCGCETSCGEAGVAVPMEQLRIGRSR